MNAEWMVKESKGIHLFLVLVGNEEQGSQSTHLRGDERRKKED